MHNILDGLAGRLDELKRRLCANALGEGNIRRWRLRNVYVYALGESRRARPVWRSPIARGGLKMGFDATI